MSVPAGLTLTTIETYSGDSRFLVIVSTILPPSSGALCDKEVNPMIPATRGEWE